MQRSAIFLLICNFFICGCSYKSTEEQVVDWIAENAIPYESVLPGTRSDDLSPWQNFIGDARIVSLGEPTHGNREVFQLKHRMIEYLVTEMDFNVVALECPFGEAFDLNRYVLEGIGDPEKALAGIYYWTWDTHEVLALIKWMRAHNADPKNKNKVKFYGFDPQDPERAAKMMFEYLQKVDIELQQEVHTELGILAVPFSNIRETGRRQWIPSEYDSMSVVQIQRVIMAFTTKKEKYVAASSEHEWKLALQYARQVELYIMANTNDGINYGAVRDLGQAKNIQWILNHEGDEAKVIVWAHNVHINNSPSPRHEWMGYHLKQWYNNDVKLVGFFFNQGSFTALDENVPSEGMKSFTVGPAKVGSFEHVISKANMPMCFLDLSRVPAEGVVSDYFRQPVLTRYSWGGYNESKADTYYWHYKLASEFDALVFLNTTTHTKWIDSCDYANLWLLDKKWSAPTNLDFENNNVGETPEGWLTWSRFKRLGITMETTGQAYQGKKCLMIHRSKGLTYGEIGPNVIQIINANPYRGKTIRVSAAVKANLQEDAFAFLRVTVESSGGDDIQVSQPPLFDTLDKYRVDATNWKIYTIEAKVDNEADIISYGVHLVEFGTVWLDAVQIEVIH